MARSKIHTALVRTSSTDYGPHFWLSWLGCERKAWLDSLERENRDPSELSGIIYFDVGSVFHALKALHYSLPAAQAMAIDTSRLRYTTAGGPLDTERYEEAIREAERLYRAYRAYWPPNDLGRVLHIEEEFRMALPLRDGVSPIEVTGGIDLVAKLGKRDLKRNGLDGMPGIYPVDTKTRSKKDPHEYELALHDAQFATYPQLLKEKYGDELQGFLVDLAYKTSTPSFERFLVPKMALDTEWPIVESAYRRAHARRFESLRLIDDGGLPPTNIRECFKKSFMGVDMCAHYRSGLCRRR